MNNEEEKRYYEEKWELQEELLREFKKMFLNSNLYDLRTLKNILIENGFIKQKENDNASKKEALI